MPYNTAVQYGPQMPKFSVTLGVVVVVVVMVVVGRA